MYKNALVLVDFDFLNDNFVNKSVNLAMSNKAHVSFLNIDDSDIDYVPYHMDLMAPNDTDEKFKLMTHLDDNADDVISEEDEIHTENRDRLQRAQRIIDEVVGDKYPIQSFFIASGDFVKKVDEILGEGKYDLLVMAHHHSSWYHRLFADHTKHIVNHFDCDILIIQDS